MGRLRELSLWIAFGCAAGYVLVASAAPQGTSTNASHQDAGAAPPVVTMPYASSAVPVQVALNQSQVLEFPRPVKRVSIGNPKIADILVVRSRQVYVLGKDIGTTNVLLWDRHDRVIGILKVEVTRDLEGLKEKLHELLPNEHIQVRSAHGAIVLSGEVSSAPRMDAALRLAKQYASGTKGEQGQTVLNMMQVGGAQQVMLDVKVAEVSRTLIKRLNIQFNAFNAGSPWKIGAVNGGASFPDATFSSGNGGGGRIPVFSGGTPIGPAVKEFKPATPVIENAGVFASYLSGDFLFNAVIDAAKNKGLAKILAEPNLTTLSGQEAQFLAGGEFPVPVPQQLGQTTIEYKQFGVGLHFLPTVLDSGLISLKVNVSVSELSAANSVTLGGGTGVAQSFFIPSLVKRSASSSVELKSGKTIAIAGLINESLRENVNKFPGLGDLPVLGMLFRSQDFTKDQTELVIFVTPRLAKSINPDQARLPTDEFVEPNDVEFYLLGRLEGRHTSGNRTPNQDPDGGKVSDLPASGEGGTAGRFGHDL